MSVDIAEAAPGATISVGRPQLVVALRGDTDVDLPIVVRRPTLRDAQRARNVLRAGQRDPAKFIVALEVEVAIAAHPAMSIWKRRAQSIFSIITAQRIQETTIWVSALAQVMTSYLLSISRKSPLHRNHNR